MSGAEFAYPPWPALADHGVPYADRRIGQRIARVQLSPDSDVSARGVRSIRRELDWLEPTGRERVFHPMCGPGGYAALLRDGFGCKWYVGHEVNAAAVRWACRRNPDPRYHFRVAGFTPGSRVPRHDLCLLTYEMLNLFPPGEMAEVLAGVAGALAPGGRVFADVRVPDEPDVTPGVLPAQRVPPGEGIFSAAEHVLEYAVRFDHDHRFVVERFRLSGHVRAEFYSWLWLHDVTEVTAAAEAAGLRLERTARLHRVDGGCSVQLCFRRVTRHHSTDGG